MPYNNGVNEESMDTQVEHVFINISRRSVKILDNEGYDNEVRWEWTSLGAQGFLETVSDIQETVDPDLVTYCFSEK